MREAVTSPDTTYGLAETAILRQPWLSTSTLPDLLARSDVRTAEVEQSSRPPRKILIRGQGRELSVEIPGDAPSSLEKGVRAVGGLLALPAGWNSYSAKPIAIWNVKTAIELLAQFVETGTPPPAAVPRVQGGIQLEWHTGETDIEIYIDSLNKVSFFAEDVRSGDSFDGPLQENEETLRFWVGRVSHK